MARLRSCFGIYRVSPRAVPFQQDMVFLEKAIDKLGQKLQRLAGLLRAKLGRWEDYPPGNSPPNGKIVENHLYEGKPAKTDSWNSTDFFSQCFMQDPRNM